MALFQSLISLLAPIFLVLSPITSYIDQILSMHRSRSSAGFALDIPLIMLTASLLKLAYWPGARFDAALLIQALVMLVVQGVLLRVALEGRSGTGSIGAGGTAGTGLYRDEALEMRVHGNGSGNGHGSDSKSANFGLGAKTHNALDAPSPAWSAAQRKPSSGRPLNFWRWRSQRPYWRYTLSLALALSIGQILIRPAPGRAESYASLLGALGLGIEALLPLPQLWSNYTARSCRGFRPSVLANWLLGDALKMAFFFVTSAPGAVPAAFKACAAFQAACDLGLGVQYLMYGEGVEWDLEAHSA